MNLDDWMSQYNALKTVLAAVADLQSNKDELMTVDEACALAKVDRTTIYRWRKANAFRWIKLGPARCSRVRIYVDSFKAFLVSKEVPSTQTNKAEVV